jgi:hypothetical protein
MSSISVHTPPTPVSGSTKKARLAEEVAKSQGEVQGQGSVTPGLDTKNVSLASCLSLHR